MGVCISIKNKSKITFTTSTIKQIILNSGYGGEFFGADLVGNNEE